MKANSLLHGLQNVIDIEECEEKQSFKKEEEKQDIKMEVGGRIF